MTLSLMKAIRYQTRIEYQPRIDPTSKAAAAAAAVAAAGETLRKPLATGDQHEIQ